MQNNIIEKNKHLQKAMFLHPNKNPFECTKELLDILIDVVNEKKPFSLIRLGDGEGRILGYPSIFPQNVYINQVLTYQYGPNVIEKLKEDFGDNYLENSMSELKGFLLEAISSADILGLPSWLHFRAAVDDKNITPQIAQSICLEYAEKLKNTNQVFDHFIFKPFHKNGFFDLLLDKVNELNVVSHTDISDSLVRKFSLTSCNHIKIPGHQSFMRADVLHYPVEYKKIIDQFKGIRQGDVYFVAAGYLGKAYCHEIKKQGGIAIDIGSIFDSWCGIGRTDAIQNKEQRL